MQIEKEKVIEIIKVELRKGYQKDKKRTKSMSHKSQGQFYKGRSGKKHQVLKSGQLGKVMGAGDGACGQIQPLEWRIHKHPLYLTLINSFI